MNIRHLLKKLDINDNEPTKQLSTPHRPYHIKTIESLGTVNSQHDQIEQSFVIHDGHTHNKSNNSALSIYSKLDDELSEIDKMKRMYESRTNKSRHHAKSIERSQSKSIEKHGLKPSNTPSFSKIGKMVNNSENLKLSGCRNLYQEELQNKDCESTCQNREPTNLAPYEQIYYKADEVQEENFDPYQQQLNTQHNQAHIHKRQLSQHLPINISISQTPIRNHECHCQQELSSFMDSISMKFNEFDKRIRFLQQQNREAKELNAILSQKVSSLQQMTREDKVYRQQAQIKKKQLQQQKEQLESILKDVLYRRQRQKILISKQNTHRQNDRKHATNNPSKSHANIRKIEHNQPKTKSNQSKMKVQNLLQKLQIKIDRV